MIVSAFDPVRISIQGDAIRDLDLGNQQGRKNDRPDSDDEDHHLHSTANGRGTMNIYQQRQQKRVKSIASTYATDSPGGGPLLT